MLKNYLTVALRNFRKYKAYSVINVLGLAIGIACCVLIMLYVQDELSYDRFHDKTNRIYRIITSEKDEGRMRHFANAYGPLAPALRTDFPEIKQAVRIFPYEVTLQAGGDRQFQEKHFFFADSSFFHVFSVIALRGDPVTALRHPNAVVLTQSTARRYFGTADPMGQTLRVEGQFDFHVAAVVADLPENSHFHFDLLAPYQQVPEILGWEPHWYWPPVYTYVLLPPEVSPQRLESQFPGFITKNMKGVKEGERAFSLQPLTDIHLNPNLESEIEPTGNMAYVTLFSAIALFILLIACINFMNLSTARSMNRAREVGLRKVVGAGRSQLIKQFMAESVFYALIAMMLALGLVELLLPQFNVLVGKQIDVDYFRNLPISVGLIGLTLFVGLIAGSYPALFLSNFQPLKVLQNRIQKFEGGGGAIRLRAALVVLQFVISIVLIIATLVVKNQLDFVRSKQLGFNKEQIVVLPLRDEATQKNYEALKNSVLTHANVKQATVLSNFPWQTGFYGFPIHAEGMRKDAEMNFPVLLVDHDFIRTFEMEIIAGRDFSKEFGTDEKAAIILNETAVKKLGWNRPLQKKFTVKHIASGQPVEGRVVGVVKDFHFQSLHHEIEPLAILIAPVDYYIDNLAVRIQGKNIAGTLTSLEQTWRQHVANRPFRYFFLDDDFESLYRKEEKLNDIFRSFALLAIFIACLGLFGLASFAAEQRRKEIGIRKTLGATVSSIIVLLTSEFTKLTLIANLIAWPVTFYLMRNWLENFAYRIDLDFPIFLMAGLIAFGIALFTVGAQAVRAALANPVEALRYE